MRAIRVRRTAAARGVQCKRRVRELGSSPEQIGNAAKLVNRIAAKFLRPGLCAVLAYEFSRSREETGLAQGVVLEDRPNGRTEWRRA